jgi:hypothetical protein
MLYSTLSFGTPIGCARVWLLWMPARRHVTNGSVAVAGAMTG